MRKTWHEDCATEYMIIYHSREARRHVWLRDRGKCKSCGKQCTRRGWDLDHIKPLLEQKGLKENELDWTYYGLDNMQTLCRPCHREKTNKDIKKRK
jgi:5-methylcytosine-specific restriction endonuclease McrA